MVNPSRPPHILHAEDDYERLDSPTESETTINPPAYQRQTWVLAQQSNLWRPPTDVFELEDKLVVMVEIAGMRDGEFNVVLQDRRLIISGTRRRLGQNHLAFHQMEVHYGEFRTGVSLPYPIAREDVHATYKDGFLRVELPRAANQQIHIVNVDLDSHPEADSSQ
jgi:HSP20 family protein